MGACFTKLEVALEDHTWILGDQFTLADISWIPLYFVIVGCGYDFTPYPNIRRWAASFEARDSYREGVLKWCPDFAEV